MIVEGGVQVVNGYEGGSYVKPCIIEAKNSFEIVQQETFVVTDIISLIAHIYLYL